MSDVTCSANLCGISCQETGPHLVHWAIEKPPLPMITFTAGTVGKVSFGPVPNDPYNVSKTLVTWEDPAR